MPIDPSPETARKRSRTPGFTPKPLMVLMLAMMLGITAMRQPVRAEESVADFYRGKTIQVVNPFAAAGLYALLAQLIADYLPRYLPGSPVGRAQAVPGGGGMQGANYLYNAAPKDGTVIGFLYDNMPTEQALGLNKLVRFDARKFGILGSLSHRETGLVAILKRAGIASLADAKAKTAVMAATGTSSAQFIIPNAMNLLMGTRFNLIPGYKVVTDAFLAMETGEADGIFTNYATLVQARPAWVSDKRFNYIAQLADVRDPKFADVPLLQELVDDPVKKDAFRFLAMSRLPGKLMVAPPGVPPARLKALQSAFKQAMHDPQLLEGMAKLNQKIEPRDPASALGVIRETVETDPVALSRVREVMQAQARK
jgi:tripartite-type tricarboxylate transporter receptor subunit TctC